MIGTDTRDVDDDVTGASVETDSVLLGHHDAQKFAGSDLIIEGYIAPDCIDYDTQAPTFETDRTRAGLARSGQCELDIGPTKPRARLWGAWADFPVGAVAGGIAQMSLASVGTEISYKDAFADTNPRPFAALDLEYGPVITLILAAMISALLAWVAGSRGQLVRERCSCRLTLAKVHRT